MKIKLVGGIAVALYAILNLKVFIVLEAMYHNTPRAALLLHEWPITAGGIATASGIGLLVATQARYALVRWLLYALIVPSPITAPTIAFDCFTAAVVVIAAPFIVLAGR